MNNEFWKDVENYEDLYEVSDAGRVRNKITGRILKPGNHHKRYLYVNLSKNGTYKSHKVHRLVAEAFIPNPNNQLQVDHIDENKTNNTVDNLRWVSCQENIDHSLSKPVNQYTLDGRLLNTYKSISEASRITGVSSRSIYLNCNGKINSARRYIWKYHI